MSAHTSPRLGDRSLFPTLSWSVYCNHASVSPASAPVQAAVQTHVAAFAERGLGAFPEWAPRQDALRARLAQLIGARPEDVAFVANTTAGVVSIALCLPWRPRDRVIVFDGEFPTNVTPWQQAARLFDLDLTMLSLDGFGDGTGDGLARLETALRGGARLVAVSAVQFQSGLAMPLAEITRLAHAHGAEVFVDAIQAVGSLPLDVSALDVDYLAAGAHKWLMGLMGAGLLYVAPGCAARLEPRVAGWLSHEDPLRFLFEGPGALTYDRPLRRRADLVESGVAGTTALAALDASTALIAALGVETIAAHVQRYHDRLEPVLVHAGFRSLRATDPAARSAILSVAPPKGRSHAAIADALAKQGVSVACPDGLVRFSPHWPNALEEIDAIAAAIRSAAA